MQNGRDTVWPHNHRTGWSCCVIIPSWVFIPKSRNSDPIVVIKVAQYPNFNSWPVLGVIFLSGLDLLGLEVYEHI